MAHTALLELTTDIISAHLGKNAVAAERLPELIETVYNSLATLGKPTDPVEEARNPAVSIRSSVKSDALACLECGAKLKTLKRHLQNEHGLTPDEYRARWNLAAGYPMVAAEYSEKRKALATQIGLGSKGGRKKKIIAAPPIETTAESQPEGEAPAKAKSRRKLGIKAG